jgi:hypothetical protein
MAQTLYRQATGGHPGFNGSDVIPTGYRWTPRVQFLEEQDFSLLHRVQADSGAHPASYTIGAESKATGA